MYVEERGQAEGSISIQRTRLAKEKWKSQEDQNKQETRRTANSWQKEKRLTDRRQWTVPYHSTLSSTYKNKANEWRQVVGPGEAPVEKEQLL